MATDDFVVVSCKGRSPKWLYSCMVSPKTKEVYWPAAFVGSETTVVMCAAFDGEPMLIGPSRHVYLRSPWIKREYPDTVARLEEIERDILGDVERLLEIA